MWLNVAGVEFNIASIRAMPNKRMWDGMDIRKRGTQMDRQVSDERRRPSLVEMLFLVTVVVLPILTYVVGDYLDGRRKKLRHTSRSHGRVTKPDESNRR